MGPPRTVTAPQGQTWSKEQRWCRAHTVPTCQCALIQHCPRLQTRKGAQGRTGDAQTRARAAQRGAPNTRHPYTDPPTASQGGRAELPAQTPGGQRGRPPWGRTGAQGAGSKLTSPRPGRGSWMQRPPLQVVPLNCPQTPPGCLAGLCRRVGGEGGIPGETPPVPQQTGGPAGAQSLRAGSDGFSRTGKRNDSCFILSRAALAGAEACRSVVERPSPPPPAAVSL